MQVSAIGMSWYEREDYPRVLGVMADAEKLPDTYDDFLQAAERGEREMKAKGLIVVRAVIKADEFRVWCRQNGLRIDAQARLRFANEAAAAEVRRRHGGG